MTTYHQTREVRINGILMREYVARNNDQPIDRFMVFRSGSTWIAWTSDTISGASQARRVSFAATLN